MWQALRAGRWLGVALLAAALLELLGACASSGSAPNTSATATAKALSCTPSAPATAAPITTPGLQATVALPGSPFDSVATHDGKWLFVSLNALSAGATHGIAVLRLAGQHTTLAHIISVSSPLGLTLTSDGRMLLVAAYSGVAFVDVAKAEAGDADALLGIVPTDSNGSTIEVALSQDGHYAFATNEYRRDMSVIDVQRAESDGYLPAALIGTVPLDNFPVGVALSPDGRYLYVASEESQQSAAQQQSGSQQLNGLGTLSVVDVARAEQDPVQAVVSLVHVGCGDGRVVLSSDGTVAWVAARGSNQVLAFDTAKLLKDPQQALIARIVVGSEPVGLLLVNGGAELLVANSNRFAAVQTPQTVYVVDTRAALAGRPALKGSIEVGIFPRELSLAGQTVVLTNYNSGTISLIDTTKLP